MMENANSFRVLVVEDSSDDLFFLKNALRKIDKTTLDINLIEADCLEKAKVLYLEGRPDLILLDLNLPESHGLETISMTQSFSGKTPIVVMTSLNDLKTATESIQKGAQDFLIKDEIKPHSLHRAIRYAIERHNQQQKIEESLEERFRKVIDKNVDGILVTSEDGLIQYANPSARTILDRSDSELLGTHLSWPLNDMGRSEITLSHQQKNTSQTLEAHFTRTEWNHKQALIINFKDISQEKKLEKMEHELIINSRYVRTLSHEIRTPLAIITGALENIIELETSPRSENENNLIKIALRNSRRLDNIIHNVLELSRLESGTARISLETNEIKSIIKEILQNFSCHPEKPGVQIVTSQLDGLPPVRCDAELIGQVVNNLLSNAQRYAKSKIQITGYPHHAKTKIGGYITLCVSNDGPGIPPENLADIFNRFIQLQQARTGGAGGYKGTGLGLAICQEIITLNQGEIWVESPPEGGVCFYFTLPCK